MKLTIVIIRGCYMKITRYCDANGFLKNENGTFPALSIRSMANDLAEPVDNDIDEQAGTFEPIPGPSNEHDDDPIHNVDESINPVREVAFDYTLVRQNKLHVTAFNTRQLTE